jgi:hypothetical protein
MSGAVLHANLCLHDLHIKNDTSHLFVLLKGLLQGGSNMTGTNCDLFTHKQSLSFLNHLVYMHLTRNKKTIHEFKIAEYKFEGISRFTYLGSVLTENNSIIAEINERIKKKGNATCYKNLKLLTSKSLKRNIKLRLYLTLIRPVVTYGAETWAAIESELQKLLIFEQKILRNIYGPVKDRDNWRIRTN